MPRRITAEAWFFMTVLYGLLGTLGSAFVLSENATVLASDLQRSTDSAAVEAKRDLCIALNRGSDSSELREAFFAFYEGKLVSARKLHPKTFSIGQIGPLPALDVRQVLGPQTMLASIDYQMFQLREYSTADVADGQTITVKGFFLVQETTSYDTVAGSTKTVYVLVPAGSRTPTVKATRVFPWYNKKNEVEVYGEFKFIDGTRAVFVENGTETRVAMTEFTRGDRELLRILADRYPREQRDEKNQEKPIKKPAAPAVTID